MRTFEGEEAKVLEMFKDFCLKNSLDEHFDELDWYALSIGFFSAAGITDIERLIEMALYARYDCHYWV